MNIQDDCVLVTGASGSMGGSLAMWLAARGVRVRAMARSPEKASFLREIEGIDIIQGDLLNIASLHQAAQDCRFVFHCAAALSGDLQTQQAANVDGVRNIARAAAEAGVERLVHISTLGVYGSRLGDVSEQMEMTPDHTAYSITKVEGERVLRETALEIGLRYAIVRPGAIYGPRGHWTRTIYSLARRNPIWFIGPGTGVLPLIYMDDLLKECWLCATCPSAEGEAFNAAYTPHPTIRRILQAFAIKADNPRYIGLPFAPVKILARILAMAAPASSDIKNLPDLVDKLVLPVLYSMEKAQRLLGWKPRIALEEGVRKSIPWMKEASLLY